MKRFILSFVMLLLLTPTVCLFSAVGTIQFDYNLYREQIGMVTDVHYTVSKENPTMTVSDIAIDPTECSFTTPLFYIMVTNNLAKGRDTERRLYLDFTPMTSADHAGFKGGYGVGLWRLTDPTNINSAPKTPKDKKIEVSNPAGTGGNSTVNWGVDFAYASAAAFNAAGGESKNFYYGISMAFTGLAVGYNSDGSDKELEFLDSYNAGLTYGATVTLRMEGN